MWDMLAHSVGECGSDVAGLQGPKLIRHQGAL